MWHNRVSVSFQTLSVPTSVQWHPAQPSQLIPQSWKKKPLNVGFVAISDTHRVFALHRKQSVANAKEIGHFGKLCTNNTTAVTHKDGKYNLHLAVSASAGSPFHLTSMVILNNTYKAEALIDSGSTDKSFISEKLVNILDIKRVKLKNIIGMVPASLSAESKASAAFTSNGICIQTGMFSSISVGSKKKKLAKVQFEYIPEAEDELELHIGDVLEVYREVEEGWWEGQLNGKVGMFPSNFVEIRENPDEEEREKSVKTDEPEKKDSSIDPETKGKKVKGVGFGNIFGSGPIKLRPSSGVWKGETEESKVEKVSGSASTTVKKSKQLEMAIARFSYHAENEDELTLKEGDTITILKKDLEDVGWWKGELNGRIGVFPDNFVEIIPTQEEV
eukprot:XP_014775639.1 PREDICTED: SH3 domain-containing kinase-binding protein 1-like [Octopus bimaculoides]